MRTDHVDAASTQTPDDQNFQPVVDDLLSDSFPGMSAVVTLLRSNIDLPVDEAAHLAGSGCTTSGDPLSSGACPHDGEHNCVRVSFAIMHDGTMANEVELCHTLVQWPYLTEMSLVSAIIAIFLPGWGQPAAGPESLLRLATAPWFYFNLIFTNSQIYVPVLSPHLLHMEYGWREGFLQHSDAGIHLTPCSLLRLFASQAEDTAVADTFTAYASAASGDENQGSSAPRQSFFSRSNDPFPGTVQHCFRNSKTAAASSSLGAPALSGNWGATSLRHLPNAFDKTQPLRLEHMGLVVTMAALRVGYFAGKSIQPCTASCRLQYGMLLYSPAHKHIYVDITRTGFGSLSVRAGLSALGHAASDSVRYVALTHSHAWAQ